MAFHPFRNLGLKAMAVILATALWFIVAGESEVERAMRIPLELRNKPADLEIVGDPPTAVDVRVLGSSALLSRVEPGEVVAVLDLSAARRGSRLFHMRPESVRVPYGVEVLHVSPATIALELETSLRRTLPVVPAVEGDPAPGYVIGRIVSKPANVDVIGPQSHVKGLTSATTEPISVSGARAEVSDTVTVGVSDGAVRLAEMERAEVVVEILPAPIEREIGNVPVRWRNLGGDYTAQIEPRVVGVRIRGQRDALERVRSDAVNAFIDLAGLGPGQYNLRVQFDPTETFGVTAAEPATVHVTIK